MKLSILTLFTIALLIIAGCEGDSKTMVTYRVTSSPAGFDITYRNSGGNTEQREITGNSFTLSFDADKGDFVSILAQADNRDARITAIILFDGDEEERSVSEGDFVIASVSASVN